jgi:hypothetical protein
VIRDRGQGGQGGQGRIGYDIILPPPLTLPTLPPPPHHPTAPNPHSLSVVGAPSSPSPNPPLLTLQIPTKM